MAPPETEENLTSFDPVELEPTPSSRLMNSDRSATVGAADVEIVVERRPPNASGLGLVWVALVLLVATVSIYLLS